MPSPTFQPRTGRSRCPLRLAALLCAALLVAGLAPPAVEAAAPPDPIPVAKNAPAWVRIGPSRTTQIAEVVVTAPANAVEFGLQFRSKTTASGYRAKLKLATDGSLAGAFSRVEGGKQTALRGGAPLGLAVRPGQRVHLEATVAAKKTVHLFLRAWIDGAPKPSGWQLVAEDSSSRRVRSAGALYLWAQRPATGPDVNLSYAVQSVAAFSLKAASRIGRVVIPKQVDAKNTFSIALIGDTQEETGSATDSRFSNRTAWLAANKDLLNLRYAVHTGDMVNWGWLVPVQYTRAKAAIENLRRANISYSLAIGNHDTRAVGWNGIKGSTGYGGSAYALNPECPRKLGADACSSSQLLRHTTEFNKTFPVANLPARVGGTFEPGKIDNSWTTFNIHGTKWLILTLEFTPRRAAVDWARTVVAGHPDHNVIIATHYYLSANGKISNSNAGYGETSGKYIYDRIVSKYSNVKIVASGHIGKYASRTDINGKNRVVSYLGDKLGSSDNPIRILNINTATGSISDTVYAKVRPGGASKHSAGKHTIKIIR